MIIIDGSGSMWGKLEKDNKYQLVTSTLLDIIPKLNKGRPLGILAFGSKFQRSCKDLEFLKPVNKRDIQKYAAKLNGFKPKGLSPVSAALSEAALKLNYKKDTAKIILIADGSDNCKKDPCLEYTKLQKDAHNLTLHLIGINLSPKDQRRYQCFLKMRKQVFTPQKTKLNCWLHFSLLRA